MAKQSDVLAPQPDRDMRQQVLDVLWWFVTGGTVAAIVGRHLSACAKELLTLPELTGAKPTEDKGGA